MVDSAHPGYSPQRILVVDDDPDILRLVSAKLDRAGFDVLTASSGQQALDMIERRGLPHLAIVDLMMPGMSGFDFCQTVQQYTDLPVIMLTAIDEEETVIRGIQHFAEDYITKPFSPRELVARVERVLRRIADYGYAIAHSYSHLYSHTVAYLHCDTIAYPHAHLYAHVYPDAHAPPLRWRLWSG